ncbi:MAG: VWA domain-containing protein, partial [Clostridiales bacterium]|nr:VWA domain-containing protein [Clostridiales bacterium]
YRNWQDWQDNAYANKQKIIRDLKRLEDLQKVNKSLESYKYNNGSYPILNAGTLLVGVSYSVWPSWQSELGLSIVDPINKFSTASCPYALKECIDIHGDPVGRICDFDSDCELNESCQDSVENLYNQKTCFNATNFEFNEDAYFVPEDTYLYRYQSLDNGAKYQFNYHMEYLEHVMISDEGNEVSTKLLGSAGQCYADDNWFEEGEGHPSMEFTYCHFGRWVSSCGNGVVEPDLGEECERSINMCTERFGEHSWYDPQIKTCSSCKWIGNCSNDRSMNCGSDEDCSFTEDISCQEDFNIEEDPNIEYFSTCQGVGKNVGKVCQSDNDCYSIGECLDFDENYKEDFGVCELKMNHGGISTTSLTTRYCNNTIENSCGDYYKGYSCRKNIAKVCVDINEDGGKYIKGDCQVDETCGDPILTCLDKRVCMDGEDRIEYEENGTDAKVCRSDDDCSSADFTCKLENVEEGECYSQEGQNLGLTCTSNLDCIDNIDVDCNILAHGGGFSESHCGGYCGDTIVQEEQEFCDWSNSDYASIDDPDSEKPYCSSTCRSSCPSGLENNIFYSGDTYFLRKYCVGGVNDGLACTGKDDVYTYNCYDDKCQSRCVGGVDDRSVCEIPEDCTFGSCDRVCVGGVNEGLACKVLIEAECPDGLCEVETLHDLVFNLEDGFPSGLNLYLPACRRLAQGQWSCHSTDSNYQKEGAWCNVDYPEHCLDKNSISGTCIETVASLEPSAFTTDIDFYNFSISSINVLFITDVSGSMRTADVNCGDPSNDNIKTYECAYVATVLTDIIRCEKKDPICLPLDQLSSGFYCTTVNDDIRFCDGKKKASDCSSFCIAVEDAPGVYKTETMDVKEIRDCVDSHTAHVDCIAAGVNRCKLKVTNSDKRIECAVDALTGEGGGLQQLASLDQRDIRFGAITFSTDISPVLSNFTWYRKDDYTDLITDINNYVASGNTYTDKAFDLAAEIFTQLSLEDDHTNNIVILLTDGDANDEDLARESAVVLKNLGVKLYTITYPHAVGNSDLWSSECPADSNLLEASYPVCDNVIKYSYQGIGIDSSLNSIYEDILTRITGTLDIGENSAQLFSGRYIPLPGDYQCDTAAQLLPVNINLSGGLQGEVRMRNLKFNYCP